MAPFIRLFKSNFVGLMSSGYLLTVLGKRSISNQYAAILFQIMSTPLFSFGTTDEMIPNMRSTDVLLSRAYLSLYTTVSEGVIISQSIDFIVNTDCDVLFL